MTAPKLLQPLWAFWAEDQEYLRRDRSEITRRNAGMLVDSCVVYACVLLFYTVLTTMTPQPDLLRKMYYVFDAVHVALCTAVLLHGRRSKRSYAVIQGYCVALECSVLLFFALEGALYSTTEPALYVPIAILLVLLLFIHGVRYACGMIVCYLGTFALLSRLHKTPEAYTADCYIAVATLLAAGIGYSLIAGMRHSEGAALHKYEQLSRTDPLTGLLNKAAARALCDRVIARGDSRCAYVMVDLDDFKRINDRYGHNVGDEVLAAVAGALRESFRQTDYLSRFGGDEFLVLMNLYENTAAVADRVDRLLAHVNALQFSQPDLQVRCSVGVALKSPEDTPDSLFKKADDALYRAKRSGKARYVIIS